jgi:hypothetical protein
MPLLPLWAFVACSRVNFTFTFTFQGIKCYVSMYSETLYTVAQYVERR